MSVVNPEAIIMDTSLITNLAALLRRSGNKILNGESKFILSAQHLSTLNHLFSNSIEQREVHNASFHVIPGRSNFNLEVYSDLQFLYDFVQRSLSLKLTSDGNTQGDFTVNISRFKNIKLLDLQKLSSESVTGIRQLRAQLQFLNCARSIKSLAEILEFAGGDQCSGFAWNELREAVFNHNGIKSIDASLQYTPWLITIDLSHNELTDLEGLNALENLKHLNVGYNKLSTLPTFNKMISSGLQVLVLRANFLESLTPLSHIVHLRDLDISDNCLLGHTTALPPLAHLANLQHLHLRGNPLAHHPHHRTRTCRHLHRDTTTVRFVLDGEAIGTKEKEMVGTYRPILSSIDSSNNYPCGDDVEAADKKIGTGDENTICDSTDMSNGRCRKIKTKRRPRDAVISDSDENTELTDSIAGGGSLSSLTNTLPDDDHLATKRQIELLREQYGDNWLQAQAGSLVQEALGLERSGFFTQQVASLSSTPYDSDFMTHASDVSRCVVLREAGKIQMENKMEMDSGGAGIIVREDSEDVGIVKKDDEESSRLIFAALPSIQPRTNQTDADADLSEDDEALDEGEQNLYLATIVDDGEDPVFLVLGRTHLAEREGTRMRERARWPLATLDRATYDEATGEFRLEFDTIRTGRKERRYILEDKDEATRFNEALQAIVDRNSADESKFISYTCMKCSSKFNTDRNSLYSRKKQVVCPFCKSSLVIRDN